jgi:hypothetical protein
MKIKYIFSFFIFIIFFSSCISNKTIKGPELKERDLERYEIMGILEVEFEALNGQTNQTIFRKAYNELIDEAKKTYGDNVNVSNIIIKKRNSKKNLLLLVGLNYTTKFIICNARGVVISEKNENN